MVWSFSKLDEDSIKAINELEKKMGIILLAFSDRDIKAADLDEDQLKSIKDLEDKLDMSLVAVTKK
ncbi:conserved hypothetical protein [Methanohalobium evestigatum Z-7303]|uniref:Uncharacterized protein n=1 Tax=Methanohalobium evestigatum (strain ATCC BAA-1072 / DSM 3721 / NBRC 107634 / OCM 161 / Z-7303) TaxID=644295 RepID=D7E7S6_METEZ|nr:hypothetical protein [Methanohalobium evestigatum]ADI74149.1 conserved hypothetical protein [Methanohalobium evestigatum Z-7303]